MFGSVERSTRILTRLLFSSVPITTFPLPPGEDWWWWIRRPDGWEWSPSPVSSTWSRRVAPLKRWRRRCLSCMECATCLWTSTRRPPARRWPPRGSPQARGALHAAQTTPPPPLQRGYAPAPCRGDRRGRPLPAVRPPYPPPPVLARG